MLWFLKILLNLSTYILSYFFLTNVYPKRNIHLSIKMLLLLSMVITQAAISFLEIPLLNLLSSIIVLVIITVSMFRVNKLNFILYDMLLYLCIFVSDMLSILSISVVTDNVIKDTLYNEKLLISRYLLNDILILISCRVVVAIIKRKKHKKILGYEILVYLLLLSFEIVSTAYISNEIMTSSAGTFLIVFLIACFLLDLYIVFVFSQLSHSRETELKCALLQQQSQMQMSVYNDLSEKYSQSTKAIHDAKRHFSTIKELIADQNIQTYYDAVTKEFDSLYPQFQYENKILKVIINNAIFRSERDNIQFNMNIEDIDVSFIADIDLTTMLANLLDNAFDACSAHKQEKSGFVLIWKVGWDLL